MKWKPSSGGWDFDLTDLRLCLVVAKEPDGSWGSYCLAQDIEVVPVSFHKTSQAAKRRAAKNALTWLDARRALLDGGKP